MVGDAIHPSHPLLLLSPLALSLSQQQGPPMSIGASKVLELQLQHQFFQYSGVISFRIDWFDLLAFQGSLKSLLQHHSSKALCLEHSTCSKNITTTTALSLTMPVPSR